MTATDTLKRLAAPLVDPAVYDFWAQKLSPTLSWDRCLARVVARHVTARDTVSLILQPSRRFAGFQPGQHVNVTVEVEGVRLTRSYSPSAGMRGNGQVRLTIKAIPEGRVSQHLVHRCQVGDVLELGTVFGDMTLPATPLPWLFVAAGSGITPIMSLLDTLTEQPLQQPVALIYWARTRADLCFYDQLIALAEREPLFSFHRVLTREPHRLERELDGHPRESLFRNLLGDLQQRHCYVCGPDGFVDSVRSLLSDQVALLRSESFSPAAQVTRAGAPVTVTLARSGRQLSVPAGTPLLAALETAGERPAYGCRMGICNTCSCQKTAGTSVDTRNGQSEPEPGALRLCINAASSDLVLDL